jgi:hypothetical protein
VGVRDSRRGRRSRRPRGAEPPSSDRDERVHVGVAALQRAPRAREERRARPRVDGQGQSEEHPLARREGDVRHREDDDRQGERAGDEGAAQRVALLGPGLTAGGRPVHGRRGAVPAVANRADEAVAVQPAARDVGAARAQVDRRRGDAGHRREGAFDRRHARRAVHPLEVERHPLRRRRGGRRGDRVSRERRGPGRRRRQTGSESSAPRTPPDPGRTSRRSPARRSR